MNLFKLPIQTEYNQKYRMIKLRKLTWKNFGG